MSDESPNQPTVWFKARSFSISPDQGIRWWPALLVILAAAGYQIWNWGFFDAQRQSKVVNSLGAAALTVVLLILWCLCLSRLKWRIRLLSVLGFVMMLTFISSLVRFKGVTGDLVPILEWRFQAALDQYQQGPVETNARTAEAASTNVVNDLIIADFPQFLGPDRNSRAYPVELSRDWKRNPPKTLWKIPVGAGWSGFSTRGTNAVTLEQSGDVEKVANYDLLSGKPIWSFSYPARYDSAIGGLGPRTVPTITNGCFYSVGAEGDLFCLDLENGSELWAVNVFSDVGTTPEPDWGMASSPLYYQGKIVVNAGGTNGTPALIAYNAEDGSEVWRGGATEMSYSSPVVLQLAGRNQIISFNQSLITAHDPTDGEVLWEHPWGNGKGQPRVAVPVSFGEKRVFFSSGYGVGGEMLEIEQTDDAAWSATSLWTTRRMKSKFANMIQIENFLYGLDDGMLACIDLRDGSLRWKEGRYGHGQLLKAGGLMLITTEQGGLVLFEPHPDGPREIGSINVFDHKQWNPPALAGQLLLLRTDREAVCLQLTLETSGPGSSREFSQDGE